MKNLEKPKQDIILIVDDNPNNLGMLFEALSESGFKILIADEGESAIEQAEYTQPDLILLDILMPGLDGFETCRRLKGNELTKEIPVIFMTALTETEDKVKGFKVGAVDYVTKPIEHEEVIARVTTHLTLQKLKKKLLEQNLQLQEEIRVRQRAEKALKVFFQAVSHDLRNPVTGMLMVLKNLQKCSSEVVTVSQSILERMIYSSERQLNLINSLLEAQAAEVQGIVLKCKPIDLGQLIECVSKDLDLLLRKNQATLTHSIPEDLPKVEADWMQLNRVFENLIINAVKHNPPGVRLIVEAAKDNQMIRCCVRDNGVGISTEQLHHLFDLYTRGSNTRHSTGLGLGLYMCRQIITAHGGEIGITPSLERGATFWFTLPIASSTANYS